MTQKEYANSNCYKYEILMEYLTMNEKIIIIRLIEKHKEKSLK